MGKTYSVAHARANLAEIVDAVEAGQEIELTRRGKSVAVVLSAARYARLQGQRAAFWNAYETFIETHDLSQVGLDEEWAEDVRSRAAGREVKL